MTRMPVRSLVLLVLLIVQTGIATVAQDDDVTRELQSIVIPPRPTTTAPPTSSPPRTTTPPRTPPPPRTTTPPIRVTTAPPTTTPTNPPTRTPTVPTPPPQTPGPVSPATPSPPATTSPAPESPASPETTSPTKADDLTTATPEPIAPEETSSSSSSSSSSLSAGSITSDTPNESKGDAGVFGNDGSPSNGDVPDVYTVVGYSISIMAGISSVLLLGSHFIAIDKNLQWDRSSRLVPNSWEFMLFASYIQQLSSFSHLILPKAPETLWTVVDSFSWTVFIPFHGHSTGKSRFSTILLFGLLEFADRIGVNEADLTVYSIAGFAALLAVMLVLFVLVAAVARWLVGRRQDQRVSLAESAADEEEQEPANCLTKAMRFGGICVQLWFFGLYPLTLLASFEIAMQVRAGEVSAGSLALAVLSLVVIIAGGLVVCVMAVWSRNPADLQRPAYLATWGSLYADYVHGRRLFFIATGLVQIVMGIVAGAVETDVAQLTLAISLHMVLMVAMYFAAPYVGRDVQYFSYAINSVKVLNYSIAFSFISSSSMSLNGREAASDALLWMNGIIILLWGLRLSGIFAKILRKLTNEPSHHELQTPQTGREGQGMYTSMQGRSGVEQSSSTSKYYV